jgi:hypothetical protein
MAGTPFCPLMKWVMRLHAAACASDHIPLSHGVMRPSGLTAVASTMTLGAAHRPTAEMNQMPIVRHPVVAGILAHGRHKDAIFEFNGS